MNCTVVFIAHRLRIAEHADEILVMESGEVVERGRHEKLLSNGKYYTRMWRQCLIQFVIVSLRIFSFFFVVQFVFSTGSVSDFELLSKRLEALSEKLEKLDAPGQNIATNQSKQKSTTTTEESSRDFFLLKQMG